MHVLRNMIAAAKPGDGLVLDLQVIRPNPVVEADGHHVCDIDGEPLFAKADAATAAIDGAIAAGRLTEERCDDHDVRRHYPTGAELLHDFTDKKRQVLDEARLRAVERPCVIRERCRLRRLRVA